MNTLIHTIIGDPKKASPTRKITTYALFGTLVAFLLSVIILIASSVAFNVTDGEEPVIENETTGEGSPAVNTSAISYEVVEADVLDGKETELVSVQEKRTKLDDAAHKFYYGAKKGTMLRSEVMASVDNMLVKFYNSSNGSIDPYAGEDNKRAECTIPLIVEADPNGYSFDIVVFGNDKAISNSDKIYKWIFDNAHTYGFVYTDNTFTYVGVAAANYKVMTGLKDHSALMDKIKSSSNNISTSVRDVATNKSASYQLYYLAKGGELKVPTNYEYTVIPDGENGYLITVNMSKPVMGGVG